jgi:hypothetical protein
MEVYPKWIISPTLVYAVTPGKAAILARSIRRQAASFTFFNPRQQAWLDHFRLKGFVIEPLTAEGRVTARVLRLNLDKRVAERRALMPVGRYPRS